MRDSENLKEILLDLGYQNITDMGKELRAKPIYRDSDSSTVLGIRKDTGHWVDFSKNISGTFEELVRLSLGVDDITQAKEYIASKWGAPRKTRVTPKPEIRMPKGIADQTVGVIGLRDKYSLTLITLKREFEIKRKIKN